MTHPLDTILLQAAASPHGLCLHTPNAAQLHRSLWNRLSTLKDVDPYPTLSAIRSPNSLDTEVWIVRRRAKP